MDIKILISTLVFLGPVAADASERLTLDAFIDRVRAENTTLKMETAKLDSARANATGFAIPPPMVGMMRVTDQRGETANGIEISQMVPFPTKLAHDKSARRLEAQAQQLASQAAVSEVSARARVLFVSLWVSQQRRLALREKKSLLESHIKLSRAVVRSDSFTRVHLLKAESDLDLLENEIIAAEQMTLEREAAVAELMNADAKDFHPVLETPRMAELPKSTTADQPWRLEAASLFLEGSREREREASASWFPDLNVRYKQMNETAMMPGYREVMVGITLPFLFAWQPASASKKASALRGQSELEYEREKRKISTERAVLSSRAESLKKQLDNVELRLLPRAEKRLKLVHNVAPRDMESLQDHRETVEAFPELKLKSLELRERYEEAVAELQRFTGGGK